MKKVDLFYVEAGGGHRAAAMALKAVIESQGRPWRVRTVNMNDILGPLDVVRKTTGISIEGAYNLLLKKGWTLGAETLMKPLHWLIRLYHDDQVRLLADFWRAEPPDLAVSLMPHFNRAIPEALQRVNPPGCFVTVLTDFADIPPHVWIERGERYIVCGTDKARQQALEHGHPPERVFQVSGMILRPSFYDVPPIDRAAERIKLGLDPATPTGLVLFGGEGHAVMTDIARRLGNWGSKLQLILMCGRNESLGQGLRALDVGVRKHVQGFTSEVPYFMQLSDFLIGKPGPGSITEALAMRLPVIIDCNAWTMPQERYNATWVEERGVGIVVKSFREIDSAVRRLLEPVQLEAYRERAAAIRNHAVFEIADILARLLN